MQFVPSIQNFLVDAHARNQYQYQPLGITIALTIRQRLSVVVYGLFLTLNLVFADIRQAWVECWKQAFFGKKIHRLQESVLPKQLPVLSSKQVQTDFPADPQALSKTQILLDLDPTGIESAMSDSETTPSSQSLRSVSSGHLEATEVESAMSMSFVDTSFDEKEEPELQAPLEIELWQRFKKAYFQQIEAFRTERVGFRWDVPLVETKWNLAADTSAVLLAHRTSIRVNWLCPRNYTTCMRYPTSRTSRKEPRARHEEALAHRQTARTLYSQMWEVKSLKEAFESIKGTLYS